MVVATLYRLFHLIITKRSKFIELGEMVNEIVHLKLPRNVSGCKYGSDLC